MSQNSERLVWTAAEVDEKLKGIMKVIHAMSMDAAEEYGQDYDLVTGANLAGFKKVATAMMEQGIFKKATDRLLSFPKNSKSPVS